MFIIQLKYRTGERWSYAYVNNKMNMTTERRNAARFKRHDNAEDVARLLTKNTKYEGRVKHVD